MIGVVGGIGPYAGIDLVQKIFNQTKAKCDQDHLPVFMLSVPHSIPDRTEFLLGLSQVNPALSIAKVVCTLHRHGVSVIGIPCNTAHAAPIFSEIVKRVPKTVNLIHMVTKVVEYIKARYPSTVTVGILSTTGTFISNIYPNYLSRYGLTGIQVSEEIQECQIQPAIYSVDYGIKAFPRFVTAQAKKNLHTGIKYLIRKGAEVIILGCTEIPLALKDKQVKGIPLIDTNMVLARSLILESSPDAFAGEI